MASASAFLTAVRTYLQGLALTPAPATIGNAEPIQANQMPALVLSLEGTDNAGTGVGERATLITDGALPWQAVIDLANPVLPEEPTFRLLNDARTVLTLPHGGLVRQDGSTGPLGAADLTVTVAGVNRPVVTGPPSGLEVRADPLVGQLTFGSALPATGLVEVHYVLGQWEQRLARLAGVLRVDTCATQDVVVGSLSDQVVEALLDPRARLDIRRLYQMDLASLSSIGPREAPANLRRRSARFRFAFEQEINRPESSGGIIRRIPVTTQLSVATADLATGSVQTTLVSIPDTP
jgi:hypothetical protein